MSVEIIKSQNDDRTYKFLQLNNKLKVLLVHDKDTDKSSASLSVGCGQLQDPVERQGLAHFCEHMLFLGTNKYPHVEEYKEYLAKNSGYSNAYTDLLETNYYFSCSNQGFKGALDRFCEFFKTPLFTQEYTEKEMNAVHSEHQKNLQNDMWRNYQLMRSSALPDSPLNKFGTGNLETLNFPDTRDYLLKFHQENYSSNLMNLVLYSNIDIGQQEKYVEEMFLDIQDKDLSLPQYDKKPFDSTNLKNIYKIVPIKQGHKLKISFFLDYMKPFYQLKPDNYISHLIGHEGKNSLLSLLIDEGLAYELSCGPQNYMRSFTMFSIDIQLTNKGIEKYEDVCEYVFQYLQILKEKGVQEWIYDELKMINKIKFDYKDKEKGSGLVSHLSCKMHDYPIEDILYSGYRYDKFERELIHNILTQFTPENMRITLSSKVFENDPSINMIERIYGTKYSVTPIEDQLLKKFENSTLKPTLSQKKLDLPEPNLFLPKNLDQVEQEQPIPRYPQKIYESEISDLWFKQDDIYNKPKSIIQAQIYTTDLALGQSSENLVCQGIWNTLFEESLREFTYQAQTANVYSSSSVSVEGTHLFFSGFNDTIPNLVDEFVKAMVQFDPSTNKRKFEEIHQKKLKEYQNFFKGDPYQISFQLNDCLLKFGGPQHYQERLSALEKLTFEKFCLITNFWLKNARFSWLVMGNLNKNQAIQIIQNVENQFKDIKALAKHNIPQIRAVKLNPNQTVYIKEVSTNENQSNSCILVNYQYGCGINLKTNLTNRLLVNILSDKAFSQLRTEEQLGYIVFTMNSNTRGVIGIQFLIQSSVKPPHYLATRIEQFILNQKERLHNKYTDEEFEQDKQSLRVKILEKDYSLQQEHQRFWNEVINNQFRFDKQQQELKSLDEITKQELLNYFEDIFFNQRKQLEYHYLSHQHIEENNKILSQRQDIINYENHNSLKAAHPLYQDFFSINSVYASKL